ncbi:uncharacterized protein LOC131641747 [Vicia villosa]|uniref:uncharacterized protein LOC131641747 n=1 Tax=Vicia villosa TaxID=3911 RepID=UPI00273B9D69|nr:uncharacterized protein LOC131641747 [Vicia villosa]
MWPTQRKTGQQCTSQEGIEGAMLVSWNIRGLNKAGKIREISSHRLNFHTDIVILIETRVKKDKANAIRDKLQLKGIYMDNYNHHANGRIWIQWDNTKVDLRYLENRKRLWKDMKELHSRYVGPWCAIGHYNNVATANERICGKLIVESEYVDFNNLLNDAGLCEMDNKGDYFTWSNKQSENPIYSRIDRLIANTDWFQGNNDLVLNVLSPHISGHALLYLSKPTVARKKIRFRFNNNWTDIEGFQECVRQSCTKTTYGRPMEILWRKLMRLQPELKKLNKQVTDLQQRIIDTRKNLDLAYDALKSQPMDKSNIQRVRIYTKELVKWNGMEEQSMLQRTKINWLRMGDGNNAFFHAYFKARNNTKSIQF